MIARMKRGAYLVNTARGKDRRPGCRARGRWRAGSLRAMPAMSGSRSRRLPITPGGTMPHHGMTPHISGTSSVAQARYAAGTREILECSLEGRPIREEYLIVQGGHLAGAGAHSYSEGDTTDGSEDAARFRSKHKSEEPVIMVEQLPAEPVVDRRADASRRHRRDGDRGLSDASAWWSRSNSFAAASARSPERLRLASPRPARSRSDIRRLGVAALAAAASTAHNGLRAGPAPRSRRYRESRHRPRSGPGRSSRSGPPVAATMVDSRPRSVAPASMIERDASAEALQHMLGPRRADRPAGLAEGAASGPADALEAAPASPDAPAREGRSSAGPAVTIDAMPAPSR